MNHRGGDREFSAWNERMALKYNPHDYHTKSILPVRYIERLRVRTIVRFLDPMPSDRILEIGCGAGNILQEFRRGRMIGLDLSASLLRQSQEKSYKTNCSFVRCFGEHAPFAPGVFDKIYCSEVLEHVPDPSSICGEARRLLKPDGIFVVSVPNERIINGFKSISRKIHLDRMIQSAAGYHHPSDMTEEWHLQEFDLSLLKKTLHGLFSIVKLKYVPASLLPVRIVALCRREK